MNLPADFSLAFPGFQLAEFDIKLSVGRYSRFQSYFVVLRFGIILAV